MKKEEQIWIGTSSQLLNISSCILTPIVIFLLYKAYSFFPKILSDKLPLSFYMLTIIVFFVFWLFWKYLVIASNVYTITNQRLILQTGVFNRVTDEIELYRVKDYNIEEPFIFRIFGLGNLSIVTSDTLNKFIYLKAIKNVSEVRDLLRENVESVRKQRGVREIDVNNELDL